MGVLRERVRMNGRYQGQQHQQEEEQQKLVIGCTPIMDDLDVPRNRKTRAHEIKRYLDEENRYQVVSWIAVDDMRIDRGEREI